LTRLQISASSRTVASPSICALHTSAVRNALTSKAKAEIKAEKWRISNANRPSPVFGTRKGQEHKWDECYLAKILVNEAELAAPSEMIPIKLPVGTVSLPPLMGFGVTDTDAEKLFRHLPKLSAYAGIKETNGDSELFEREVARTMSREKQKATTFAKVVDLRNADADGIAYENKRRIIVAFSTPENPFDPGRTEVQAAILTYRIRNLGTHLAKFPRDLGNRLGLRKLVHHRAKILKYLKRTSVERYEILLEQLGMEPASVEGELIV
ncbi:S15/NS1 RNA-binding domain-containing protein, partial [Gymnopus androsaceus JB14]